MPEFDIGIGAADEIMTDEGFGSQVVAPVSVPVGLGGGANQSGARAYNDRLVLSLIRRMGPSPKAELARQTGLSPQTLTLIVKRLEKEALLISGTPVRGRVGQPSVPYDLNPEAAFSFGLKIGRRSIELTLCDFCGAVRQRAEQRLRYPTPERVMTFLSEETAQIMASLSPQQRQRMIGVGIAIPFELWNWSEQLAVPSAALQGWRDFPLKARATEIVGAPVIVCNDATAACAAETFRSGTLDTPEFLYLFVGWFVGGGVVLDGTLFPGRTGNAGALGSMLVHGSDGPVPLLERASIMVLERMIGADAAPNDIWCADPETLAAWLDCAADAIAQAAANAAAVIDFAALRIDGALPVDIRARLVARVAEAYARLDTRGLSPLRIEEGRVGSDARSVGAAILPILSNFSRDSDVLLKQVAE